MALAPGAKLGPYEVVSLVGAGGMGEVYKGRDTRLDRTVAIKILPAHLAERADRRARFEAEIRTISSLNHPHICTVFDVGEHDGLAFLVMEFLEGETLDDRITRGPLPAGEVLRLASQIADALDHAHRARITHRDLKPSNVMLTSVGAKLLDFGLARMTAMQFSDSESTLSVPAAKLTAEGTILGTFQYMAPEQLEGKEADSRTDIFAFGTLVFEMATGQKAFEGKSQASLIASILTARPPAISSTRPEGRTDRVPAALDHLVQRCLAKSPDERWQTARDVKLELEWVAAEASRPASTVVADAPSGWSRRVRWVASAASLAVLAAAALGIGRLRESPPRDVVRFTFALPSETVIGRGPTGTRVAISPDGRHLAFVTTAAGVDRLWVQSLNSLTPTALLEGAESPFWSPDSRFIGFFAPGEGRLKKIALAGGPPHEICAAAVIDVPVWHQNGTILFAQTDKGIFRVSSDGGEPIQLTRLDATRREINHLWPEWLPDGRHFLYTATNLDANGLRAPRAVYVRSIDSDDQRLLTHAESRMMFAAPGYLLYVKEGALLSQPFDVRALKLTGDPVEIADALAYSRTTGLAGFTASPAGVLAYYSGVTFSDLVSVDRSGRSTGPGWVRQPFASAVRVSPDGEKVIVDLQDPRAGASDIWIYDLSRRVASRFTTDPTDETTPVWSPDGRRVVFSSDRGGSPDLFSKTTDGLGTDELVLAKPGPQTADDWSMDGNSIVFDDNSRETGLDLSLLPLNGDHLVRPLIRTRFQEFGGRLSPDGAWVAFVSNDTGASEVYVAALRGSSEKKRISTTGGIAPRWRGDGKELFYVATDSNSIVSVPVSTRPAFTAGSAVVLFPIRTPASRRRARDVGYDVSPDGQRFVINTARDDPGPNGITVVLNWAAALDQ